MQYLLRLAFPIVLASFFLSEIAVAERVEDLARPPNIILILADDLGWNDLGCYGNRYHETPHIDALAKAGMRFTDAYSGGPTCAPSRACLLSGQYCGRHGIFRVNQGALEPAIRQRLIAPKNVTELPRNIVTIADSLAAAGYKTGCYGKWHLGHKRPELHPSQRGFLEAVNIRAPSGEKRYFYPNFSTLPDILIDQGTYHADLLTDLGIKFIEDHQESPFFLYLPYFNVHGPWEAPQDTIDKYVAKEKVEPGDHSIYAAMTEELDRCVGRVLETLGRLELTDNTVVLFTSDNGAVKIHNNAPLRGGKGQLYEGGIRVPMIVRWPGVVQPNSVSNQPVSHVDLYPTFIELADAELPSRQTLDGVSLTPTLSGSGKPSLDRDALFWHYPTYQSWSKSAKQWVCEPHSAVRIGDYKLIEQMDSNRLELYNLREDLGEKHNLAAEMPDKTAQIKQRLDRWRRETNVPMPKEKQSIKERKQQAQKLKDIVTPNLASSDASQSQAIQHPNVLFIAVDDLRAQLGCYGNAQIKSPHIDALAKRGLLFERAYCQQAVCSPSRTSVLTGLRPDSTKVWDLYTFFRDTIPDVITLPQHFRTHGYYTESIGKIFHKSHLQDDDNSWSTPSRRAKGSNWVTPSSRATIDALTAKADELGLSDQKARYYATLGPPVEAGDVSDNEYPDGHAAQMAIESLRVAAKNRHRPFFLAVGFVKPHLPFSAPKKYWDIYDEENIALSPNTDLPKDCPKYAGTFWGELRHYAGMPDSGPVSDEQAVKLIHGYYACTSYTDAQIGRVLAELEQLGLRDDTIVVLWSDHGWKLGEHGLWCKHTNFELDARVPLVLAGPGITASGKKSRALVELVDLYPTLCHLCGLTTPEHVEGTNFAPLLDEPNLAWKTAAFSQFPRNKLMGYSIRTNRYRFTEWVHSQTGDTVARELYDHKIDSAETANLADLSQYDELVSRLAKQRSANWQAALPVNPGTASTRIRPQEFLDMKSVQQ